MRLSLLLRILVVVGTASTAAIVACGGNDNKPDAKVYKDAFVPMDAASNVVGKSCGSNADCGSGGLCAVLTLSGSGSGSGSGSAMKGHPFCTFSCSTGAADTCATGYTGPGFPVCFISNGMGGRVCGIICQDTTGGQLCPNGTCNGTCPGTMTCTIPLSSGSGSAQMMVGDACF